MKKQQKKKNPFKVDHVRSIKLKAKAKQYTGQLKQLKAAVSDRVKSTNEQLSALQEVVRQTPKKPPTQPKAVQMTAEERKERTRQATESFNKSQSTEAAALEKLTTWTCK